MWNHARRHRTGHAALHVARAAGEQTHRPARRGQHFSNRYDNSHDDGDFERAERALAEAWRLDPKLAEAAAEIAHLHIYRSEAGDPSHQALEDVIDLWLRRGLDADRESGLIWSAIVAANDTFGRTFEPEVAFEFAVLGARRGPRVRRAVSSLAHEIWLGSSEILPLPVFAEARRIEPLHLDSYLNEALALRSLGRREEALELLGALLRLEPQFPPTIKFVLLSELGRHEEAEPLWEATRASAEAYGGAATLGAFRVLSRPDEASSRTFDDYWAEIVGNLEGGDRLPASSRRRGMMNPHPSTHRDRSPR